eukprot:550523_1
MLLHIYHNCRPTAMNLQHNKITFHTKIKNHQMFSKKNQPVLLPLSLQFVPLFELLFKYLSHASFTSSLSLLLLFVCIGLLPYFLFISVCLLNSFSSICFLLALIYPSS